MRGRTERGGGRRISSFSLFPIVFHVRAISNGSIRFITRETNGNRNNFLIDLEDGTERDSAVPIDEEKGRGEEEGGKCSFYAFYPTWRGVRPVINDRPESSLSLLFPREPISRRDSPDGGRLARTLRRRLKYRFYCFPDVSHALTYDLYGRYSPESFPRITYV